MTTEKTIRITCQGAAEVPLSSLLHFQGNLKTLEEKQFNKLKASIINHGFSFPVSVWRKAKDHHIIDGHQRVFVLKKMLEDGYTLKGKIPVDWIHADNLKEAKAKVLLACSQYGRYDEDQVYEFMHESGLSFEEMKLEMDLPQLNMGTFQKGWFDDLDIGGAGEDGEEKASFGVYSKEQIAEAAFNWFRENGFPFRAQPLHIQMQEINRLSALDEVGAEKTSAAAATPDAYHKHRLMLTAKGMKSPFDGFSDDKILRRAIEKQIEYSGKIGDRFFSFLKFVSGVQMCANFPAGYAMKIYREHGVAGGVVVDPSCGFGGRLLGWFASRIGGKYIGIDPNSVTQKANRKMVEALNIGSVTLIESPFEDFNHKKYKGKADLVFTSPPYFNKELYSEDDSQSYRRYPELDLWISGFLEPLMKKSYELLKNNRTCIVNIANTRDGSRVHDLESATEEAAEKAGFALESKGELPMPTIPGIEKKKGEPVYFFRKN